MQQSEFAPQTAYAPNETSNDTGTQAEDSQQPHMQQMVAGQAMDGKYCSDCGQVIARRAEVCPQCGVRQNAGTNAQTGHRTRSTAAILAFFLGGFGAHRFYYGQVGLGFLYLFFFWTLIPGFVAFIEFIILLMMSDEEFNAKFHMKQLQY